jgi:hypothetical protein
LHLLTGTRNLKQRNVLRSNYCIGSECGSLFDALPWQVEVIVAEVSVCSTWW